MFDNLLPYVVVEAGSGTSRPAASPTETNRQTTTCHAAGSGTSRPAASLVTEIQQTKSVIEDSQARGESQPPSPGDRPCQSTLSDGGPSPSCDALDEGAGSGSMDAEVEDHSEDNKGPKTPAFAGAVGKVTGASAFLRFNRCFTRMAAACARAAAATSKGPILSKITTWLMDTGSAIDLVSVKDVDPMKHLIVSSGKPLQLWTANGLSWVNDEIAFKEHALGQTIKPYVVQSSPAVLSIGWRCLELGYSFYWQANQMPILVCPDGDVIHLEVNDYVPYMRSKASSCDKRPQALFCQERMSFSAPAHVLPVPVAGVSGTSRAAPPSTGDVQPHQGEGAGAASSGDPLPAAHPVTPPPVVSEGEMALEPGQKRVKEEATSLKHLMTHFPKNPYCKACQRAKMRRKRAVSQKVDPVPTRFGSGNGGPHHCQLRGGRRYIG